MRIAIDLMGGDLPPEKLLKAITATAPLLSAGDTLVILCTEDIAVLGSGVPAEIIVAPQVITHSDPPLQAVRKKHNSTMIRGIKLIAEKSVDAFISLGNTGALFTAATIYLPKISKQHRPALFTVLPSRTHPFGVIDVGGRINAKADHLLYCAQMGAQAMQALFGIPRPRVGLLNIGEESLKGTAELQQAYQLLQTAAGDRWTFSGNIEGRSVFSGDIDLLVTDGFTGNILLKIAEGVSQFVLEEVSPVLPQDQYDKLKRRLDYREYPGAVLCGVDGLVMKCHGNTGPEGLSKAILEAYRLIQNRFVQNLKNHPD